MKSENVTTLQQLLTYLLIYLYLQLLTDIFCVVYFYKLVVRHATTLFPIILQNRDRITIENAAKTYQDRRSGIKKEI